MSLPEEYLTLYLRLLGAAGSDDTRELHALLECNPYMFALLWGESPLHVACMHGSLQFVKEVIKLSPGLARFSNNEGFSPMHVASIYGHVEIVQVLVDFDSGLCLVEDKERGIIPLHVAAMEGREGAVRVLLNACPESLQRVTKRSETVLHLALKNRHSACFKVLLEEIKKYNQEELLNWKDNEGNTVLHVATSLKLIEILEPLLSLNSTNGPVVDVNSVNARGHTPLDIHYETTNDVVEREIRRILHDAGAIRGRFLNQFTVPQPSSVRPQPEQLPVKIRNVVLMVLIMAATFAYSSCNPPDCFKPKSDGKYHSPFPLSYMVLGSNQYRAIFYYMMFNIAGYLASMCGVLVLIWPLPYRSVVTFVLVTTFVCYVLMVDKVMPQFSLILGSFTISSTPFVWLSALSLMFCWFIVPVLVKLFRGVRRIRGRAATGTSRTIQMV
ncbi:ankyrin repeat-containing protein BDA1-like [Actinidia eriantha]|uniref:ankyrin repeat-containing protein BDA1-like n=1 Tax=Actinidia eriantha TaxID=165200 RepID=UPI0025847DFE|nr:ankyrin repeat-containing protein BDA1-like [Actinidia eriantha]